MGEICNLGRVKAPIIYILSKREQEIRNYVEKIAYKPAFTYKNCEFVYDNQYDTPEQAAAANPNVNEAEVVEVKTEKKREKPPKLFKLSTLQVEAFKTLKMDASTTLAVLQKLYEGRLVTYPRTDCEFISTETDIEGIKNKVVKIFNFDTSLLKRTSDEVLKDKSYCNDKAIASEGHTAIIPTGLTPPENMDKRLADLYELICREFLAAFGETKETFHQVITANPRTSENPYQYKEKEDLVSGWEFILNPEYKPAASSGIKWAKGMILNPIEFSAKECKSKPPKRFNSGALIKLLDHPEDFEDEGGEKIKFSIGTPATRSGIIDQCIKTGYITDKKGVYYATEKAETVVNNYESVPIFQPNESGKWESYLTKIRQGEADPNAIHDTLMKEMSESVEKIKGMNSTPLKNRKGGGTVLGKCPKCGADIVSATYKSGKKGVSCTAECGMKFINRAWGKELTDTQVKMLLEGKSVQLKDLTSKEGKKYDLTLIPNGVKEISYTNKDGEQVNAYSWNFADKQDKAPLGQCPHCNGNVVMSNFGPMCENRCGMLLSNVMGKKPTEAEIKSLLAGKKTLLKGLKSKAGKPYNMYVTPTGVGERTYQKEDGSEHKGYQWTFKFEFEDNKKKK